MEKLGRIALSVNLLRRIDLQVRRYQKTGRVGLYAGALVRYSKIEGEPFVEYSFGETRETLDPVAFSRIGAGVVFGVRGLVRLRQLKRHVFWGANVHLGNWLNDAPTPLRYEYGPHEDFKRVFANIEFAKVGVRF